MTDKKLFAQRGLLESVMGKQVHRRLELKYGHHRLWKAFAQSVEAVQRKTLRTRLASISRSIRTRLMIIQDWLTDGNEA